MNGFTINQKLPSLNEVISVNRSNRFMGAKFNKDIEEKIGWCIRNALASSCLHQPDKPVMIRFTWKEANKRRDCDNIQSSQKFILDALVKNGVLVDDNRKYVKQTYHQIVDSKEFGVEVELIEVETHKSN